MGMSSHSAQDEAQTPRGHDRAEMCPEPLYVEAGLPDDRRAALRRGHPLFDLAAWAWRAQDGWSAEEHRGFWTALLAQWPRQAGPRPTRERLGALAAYLRERGVSAAEIAEVIGVEADTLRRRLFEPGELAESETTYAVRGERFRHPWAWGGDEAPLPRVYATFEQPPTLATHYPAALDLAAEAPPPSLVRASRLAHEVAPHPRDLVSLGSPEPVERVRTETGQVLFRVLVLRVGDPAYRSCPINERLEPGFPGRYLDCPAE
jgi:hypothetical protein